VKVFFTSINTISCFDTFLGSSILKVSAHDNDVGANAEITYSSTSLSDENADYFSVDVVTGVISLSSNLNAELNNKHLLQITATDTGIPRKSSFTSVEVTVLDVNDNVPQFLAPSYSFTYSHFEEASLYVGQVHAFDADVTDELVYSVQQGSDYVMVSSDTGSVYLKADPSPLVEIKATVSASDKINTASVEITILRIGSNRQAPKLPKNINAYVKENALPKVRLVTKVTAIDTDPGKYGEISYQLDNQHYSEYFTLHSDGSLYTTDVIFDREEIGEFALPVRAVDGGGRFSLSTITVIVEDENDVTPQFEFTMYEANVMTSQVTEESLLHAMAIDTDYGNNQELKYVAHGLE